MRRGVTQGRRVLYLWLRRRGVVVKPSSTRTRLRVTYAILYTGAHSSDGSLRRSFGGVLRQLGEQEGISCFSAGCQNQDSVFSPVPSRSHRCRRHSTSYSRSFDPSGVYLDPHVSRYRHPGDRRQWRRAFPIAGHDPGLRLPVLARSTIMGGCHQLHAPADLYNFQRSTNLFTGLRGTTSTAQALSARFTDARVFEASYLIRTSDQFSRPSRFAANTIVLEGLIYTRSALTCLTIGRRLEEFGPAPCATDVDTFRVVAGFRGEISDDCPCSYLKWEVSYNYGDDRAPGQPEEP